jgi:Helix-turn-helix domain
VRKAFKYRLFTNANQERELDVALETHRRLDNAYLDYRELAYSQYGVTLTYVDCSRWFKSQRKTNPFFARINFSSAQATARQGVRRVLPPGKGRKGSRFPTFQGPGPLRLDRVPRLRRRHQAHRRQAPRDERGVHQG